MIFQFGQHMADKEKERGRLFSIQMDGSDSVPFIIKKDRLLIGRGDSCEIRIYVDGVAHEHCVIIFNEEGRGFVEPVNKCGLTYLNGESIERQVSLEHNDVITVVKRSFRFHYPSSSKFYVASEAAASFEDDVVKALADFEVEDVFSKKGKDISEKRVTFGPRLSPEEFDKRMPPASPLRKGSLPRALKGKTPSFEQDVIKSQIKKNLFVNSPASKVSKTGKPVTPELPESSVVLKRLNYSSGSMKESIEEEISRPSRPLFSEIVKKSVFNPSKNTVQNVITKYSPQKFIKKTKLKDSKKMFYKSPRRPVHPRLLAVGSTGHANSPETIVICKKRFSPNSPRNSVSSVKRRKSLRLLQEKVVTETSSESHLSESNENIEQNDNFSRLSAKNTPIHTPTATTRKSLAIKRKVNDENKDDTPAKSRDEDISFRKRRESSTPSQGKAHNSQSRKSAGTPVRKKNNTPARKTVCTPSRKSIGTPARKSIGTPARKSLSTSTREGLSTSSLSNEDEIPEEFVEDRTPNEFDEDEPENNVPAEEVHESEAPSNSSSLVAAINNVAQIDQNNLDRSLKDIQNIVQTLSCHSNVPTLDSNRLTADMCVNAVKKLALTISMINAFHMYNRIIDDVSTFPLCFPSTSFETNTNSLRRLQRTPGHQNEDNAGLSRFQDIMQTFFSSSVSNQRRCLLRTSEDQLSSDTESPLSNKRSRRSSSNKIPLKAIDSGIKATSRKSSGTQISSVSDSGNEAYHSDQSSSENECVSTVSSTGLPKSPRTPASNKEKVSSITSRASTSLDKSVHLPSLDTVSSDELSFDNDVNLQKSKGARVSSTSAKRPSTGKSVESVSNSSVVSSENQKTKKSPHIFRSVKISPNKSPEKVGSIVTAYSKMLRNKKSNLLKPKSPKVSHLIKKFAMTTSKKLKAQKKEKKHRSDVLKKVKYRAVSPEIKILKNTQKSLELLRTQRRFKNSRLKEVKKQSDLVKPKAVRLSQKIIRNVKSKKRSSSALELSNKLVTSSKELKKQEKKKPVALKSRVLKNKRSSVSSRLSSQKRKSAVGTSSLSEMTNKRTKRSRSANVKSDINKKNDALIDVKSSSTNNDLEIIPSETKRLRKRKICSEKFNLLEIKKRSDEVNENNDPVDNKRQSTKKDSEQITGKTKTKSTRKKKLDENVDLNTKEENTDNKEIDNSEKIVAEPEAKNTRKRKAVAENLSGSQQLKKRPKAAAENKTKRKTKVKVSKTRTNIDTVNSEEKEDSFSHKEASAKAERSTRSTKRKQKAEIKEETPKLKRNAQSAKGQNIRDTEINQMLNEDNVQANASKKLTKRTKIIESKENEVNKLAASPQKKTTRNTRRKNLQTVNNVENKETSLMTDDLVKVNEKKGRKRKVVENINKTPTKVPLQEKEKVAEKKNAAKKDKKKASSPKDTPKKVGSRRGKIEKEVSPVQRIQRSLRSRK